MITALNTPDQFLPKNSLGSMFNNFIFVGLSYFVSLHTQKINTILMLLIGFPVKFAIAAHPTTRLLVELLLSGSLSFQEF